MANRLYRWIINTSSHKLLYMCAHIHIYICHVMIQKQNTSRTPMQFTNDYDGPKRCIYQRLWWPQKDRDMMTSSNGYIYALLALCAGNSPVTGEFPSQRPVTRSFDVFFDPRLNKRLSKQSLGWWFETPSRPLWRHCNGDTVHWGHFGANIVKYIFLYINIWGFLIFRSLFILGTQLSVV